MTIDAIYKPMLAKEGDEKATERVACMMTPTDSKHLDELAEALGLSRSRSLLEGMRRLYEAEKRRIELVQELKALNENAKDN